MAAGWVEWPKRQLVPKGPEGTAEDVARFQPSLRDFEIIDAPIPNVETLGYFQSSLRDEEAQILVALDRKVCARTLSLALMRALRDRGQPGSQAQAGCK